MENVKNTKMDFTQGVVERINSGKWGIKEVEYLTKNSEEYNLNYEDLGLFLVQVFKYVYAMAMEDGFISTIEQDEINQINNLATLTLPPNKIQIELFKRKIMTLTKQYEKTNIAQENLDLEQAYKQENKMKENIGKVFYKTPYPKLTPYTTYE